MTTGKIVVNLNYIFLNMLKAVDGRGVSVYPPIKELRQSKGTTSYCTELKQHNVDKTHIGELGKNLS
jgi:hypothetical protein